MWLWSVHSYFQWYKNYKNRPRNARVVVKNNVASFFSGHDVYLLYCGYYISVSLHFTNLCRLKKQSAVFIVVMFKLQFHSML